MRTEQASSTIHSSPNSSASDSISVARRSTSFQSTDALGGAHVKNSIKVHIIQAKLDAQAISELYSLIDLSRKKITGGLISEGLNLEVCSDASKTDIIITGVRMKRRLERHLDWSIARQKAIVTPQWLRDSVAQNHALPCGTYAAITELHDETVTNCPDSVCEEAPIRASWSPKTGEMDLPIMQSLTGNLNYKSRYACCRASPLVCPNQALVGELGILCRSRELEGNEISALGYERAVAVIKAYPHSITPQNFLSEIVKLPFLGDKILSKIKEFIQTGAIAESRAIFASERFQSLSDFATVYNIGPSTARTLYDIGLRTIKDMENYYEVPADADSMIITSMDPVIGDPRQDSPQNMSIKVALALRADFNLKISRGEVEEMHAVVMKELDELQRGCISTIVGGYRRGKTHSNDVDIVISHPDLRSGGDQVKGLCARLVKRLYSQGMVTHVMHLSGFHAHDALRTSHWDSLEKALTVFVLPPSDGRRRIHRRLDLIFTAPEAYWTAVIGWSGSKMFERDLRRWAKVEKGMKFDSSGLTRRHDSKLFLPKSEKEVFDILDLEWVDPTLRNADV